MPSPWVQREQRAQTIQPGRCRFYAGVAGSRSREQHLCKRTGRLVVKVEGITPTEGPWCWQHARIVEDRTVAHYMNSRRVTVEEVQR